jgi:molecular chaperone DnaK
MERLNAAWQAASEDMYKAGGEQGGAANGAQDTNAQGSNGEATDVDFEEVKESK